MSKSVGNVVAPQDRSSTSHGADILRLWVAAEDYRDDVRISHEILDRAVEAYRRIRNTARFLLGNLAGFDPRRDACPTRAAARARPLRSSIALHGLVERCRRAYDAYEFHVVYHALNNFCSVDLSALYLDIVKDRLYCERRRPRRAPLGADRALRICSTRSCASWRPILSFTAEEIWGYVPGPTPRAASVLLADFPLVAPLEGEEALLPAWDRLLAVREAVTKALEHARQEGRIGHSLDACVRLGFVSDGPLGELLAGRFPDLPTYFIVSQVERDELQTGDDSPLVPGLRVAVERAAGDKCARCWNYRPSVGSDASHPTLCAPCVAALAHAT